MHPLFPRAWPRLSRWLSGVGAILWRTVVKYNETDGEQRAASFAYYAFFSLFPLLLLMITIGSTFLGGPEKATKVVVEFVAATIPLDELQVKWFLGVIQGVIASRKSAGIIAFSALFWSALRFFQSLVHGVNKAWGTKEYSWYRMPVQNLFMLAVVSSAFFLGVFMPPAIDLIEYYFYQNLREPLRDIPATVRLFDLARRVVPTVVLFYGFLMFYKLAPRRRTPYRDVWVAALLATVSLEGLQRLFVLYTRNISDFNRLYGTLGSVVAILLWIYLSGSVIIICGCLSAAAF